MFSSELEKTVENRVVVSNGDRVQKHVYTNQRKIKHWILLWFLWNIIPLIFLFSLTHSLSLYMYIDDIIWSSCGIVCLSYDRKDKLYEKYFFIQLFFSFFTRFPSWHTKKRIQWKLFETICQKFNHRKFEITAWCVNSPLKCFFF